MGQIGFSRTSAPATDFYYETVILSQNSGGNNATVVRHRLYCYNRGSTGAYAGYNGAHNAYFGGGLILQHAANPFLPSGYATNQLRWLHETDKTYTHDSRGHYNGGAAIAMSTDAAYTTWGGGSASGSIAFPRIPKAPLGPTSPALSAPTQTTLTYNATPNTDDGGSAVTSRTVQVATDAAFTAVVATLTPASLTNVSITGLTARTKYYVRSRTNNAIGVGAWSSAVNADTVDLPDAGTVTLVSKTSTSITVDSNNPAYTGGTLTARETQISTDSLFAVIVGTSSAAQPVASGLTRATQYYLRSRVQNAVGWGPWSATLAVKTNLELPSAPTSYSATDVAATTASSSSPAVADNGGGSITDVRAQINTTATDVGASTVTMGGNIPVFFSGLVKNTLYYYRLAVANTGDGGGWGAWGAWVPFTTKNNVPNSPTDLAAGSIGDTTATLSWDAPSDLSGSSILNYVLQVATNPGFSESLQSFTPAAGATSRALAGLLEGTTHYARIWTNSTNGLGSSSTVLSFTTTGVAPTPSDVWMRIAGVWKPGKLWMKIAGTWRQGILWQRIGGVWRKK